MGGDGTADLVRTLARVSAQLYGRPSVDKALHAIVRGAARAVPAASGAGVAVVRADGTVETPAATSDRAARLDRAQADTREGPLFAFGVHDRAVHIADMAAERRWPRFAQQARALGVASLMVHPIVGGRGERAALSLHAGRPGAFTESAAELAALFAAQAALTIEHGAEVSSLNAALVSRQTIGEAVGILMERHRIDARQAFALLSSRSQELNVKLRVVAEHTVLTGQDPAAIAPEDLAAKA